MEDKITILTLNPNDITLEEAEELGQSARDHARELSVNCEVEVSAQQREGYGVTWFEVLHVSLLGAAFAVGKAVTDETAKRLVTSSVQWARNRFRGRKKESKRPVYVAIYGPDGGVVKSVVVKNATDDPEDRTEQDNNLIAELRKRRESKSNPPSQ
jgi:hypothetical protein